MTRLAAPTSAGAYRDVRTCQWTIFLVACAVLVLEVAITRLFSVLMYYHYAFMAVSLAMFGLGASGLWLFRFEDRYRESRFTQTLAMWSLAAAIAVIFALVIVIRIPITLEFSNINALRLLLIYGVLLVPFFCAGMAIALILFQRTLEVSRLYSWDLIGAALGAFAAVPLLNSLGPIRACLIAASMLAIACTVAGWSHRRWRTTGFVSAGIIAALFLIDGQQTLFPLKYIKGRSKGITAFEKWNSLSYITVEQQDARSDLAKIEIDADAATFILRDPFSSLTHAQIRDTVAATWASSLPHALADTDSILIVGPGGGIDIVFALAWGARHIDAVELNPIIANDVMRGAFAEFSGNLYSRPEVSVIVDEGRSFIRQCGKRYDHIQLTLVDTWAATAAGAFSLSENHLYTVEAFEDYIKRLTPDGLFSITRWSFPQPRETLRMMTTAFEAARAAGIEEPHRHCIIASIPLRGTTLSMASFIFKRSPVTVEDHQTVTDRIKATSGTLLYSPFASGTNAFHAFARSTDHEQFYAEYPYNVRPVTDDRPFFFNIVKLSTLKRIFSLELESRKNNIGMLNLIAVAVISVIMVGLFFFGPLWTMRRGRELLKSPGGPTMMAYFVAIGLGFILVEVALIQQFVLYLGHPVFALTVILTALLISAGIGALLTRRLSVEQCLRYRGWHFFAIVATVLLETLLLPFLFHATLEWPLTVRILIAIVALAPVGYFLGHPFPIGMKHVESRRHDMIPWAWGLNGAASVLGSVAAICIAMVAGYTVVVIVGAVCYVGAWLCLRIMPQDTG